MNPILSENITGLARYIRGITLTALENVALWHERDISHSSVERIIAPDSTIAIDFALDRLDKIMKGLLVYPKNMKINIDKLMGLNASQKILLALTKENVSKKRAYDIVQKASKDTWLKNISFIDALLEFKECNIRLGKKNIRNIINNRDYKKNIDKIFSRIF